MANLILVRVGSILQLQHLKIQWTWTTFFFFKICSS